MWAFVDSVRQDQPLLPKLCHLKLAVPVDSAAAYLRLLSPSLRHLKIAFLPSRDFALVGALTSLIASKLPRLQTLCVDSGLRAVPARYLTALSRLQQLQTLDLEASGVSLPFSVLKLILQNTTLRALYALIIIDHMGEEDLDFGDNLLELQDISLNGCAQDLVWFFAHARLLNLSEFRVVMNGTPTELSISNALSSICGDLPRTLTSFCLYFNEPQIERSPPLSSAELFQPMLAFQDLTNIDIEFDAPTVSLSDQDAETFATAFPNLDSFRLVSSVRGADQHEVSQPTLAALVSFAKHCPALRVLNFASLDVRTCPSPLSIPAVGHASLKYLSFSRLLGGGNANLLDLAVIVDRLFPNIDTPRSATVRAIISSRSATVDNDGLGVPYGVPGRLAFRESRREATLDSEASRMLRFFLGAVQRGRKPVDDGCYPHEDSDTSESPVPDEGLVEVSGQCLGASNKRTYVWLAGGLYLLAAPTCSCARGLAMND